MGDEPKKPTVDISKMSDDQFLTFYQQMQSRADAMRDKAVAALSDIDAQIAALVEKKAELAKAYGISLVKKGNGTRTAGGRFDAWVKSKSGAKFTKEEFIAGTDNQTAYHRANAQKAFNSMVKEGVVKDVSNGYFQ